MSNCIPFRSSSCSPPIVVPSSSSLSILFNALREFVPASTATTGTWSRSESALDGCVSIRGSASRSSSPVGAILLFLLSSSPLAHRLKSPREVIRNGDEHELIAEDDYFRSVVSPKC